MAIVGIALVRLTSVCLALAVMGIDLRRHRAKFTRKLPHLQSRLAEARHKASRKG